MAKDYSGMNVYQKLNIARQLFLISGASKSGKNPSLEFLYFELADIVPVATKIFNDVGLVALVNFYENTADMSIVNTDAPDQIIEFTTPIRFIEANRGTNPVMAVGSTHTYFRRYLYMLALDIVEADAIDGAVIQDKEEAPAPAPKKSKKPATPKERKEIKEELTAQADPADDLQLGALMSALNTLLDKDPDQEEFAQNLAQMTNGFTEITKEQCEAIINGIQDMLGQYED